MGRVLTPQDIAELIEFATKQDDKLKFVPFGKDDEKLVLCTTTRELYEYEQDDKYPVLYITSDECINNFYVSNPHPNEKKVPRMSNGVLVEHKIGNSKGPMLGLIGVPCRLKVWDASEEKTSTTKPILNDFDRGAIAKFRQTFEWIANKSLDEFTDEEIYEGVSEMGRVIRNTGFSVEEIVQALKKFQ